MSRGQEIHPPITHDGITRIQTPKIIIDSRAQHSGRQEVTIGALRILLLSWRSGASNGDYFGEHFCQHFAVRVSRGTATRWSRPTHAQRVELGSEALSHCGRHKPYRHRAEQQELHCALFRRRHWGATFNFFASLFLSFLCTHSLLWAPRNEDSKRWRILGPSLPPSLTFLSSHLRFLFARSRPCLHLYFLASYSLLRRRWSSCSLWVGFKLKPWKELF